MARVRLSYIRLAHRVCRPFFRTSSELPSREYTRARHITYVWSLHGRNWRCFRIWMYHARAADVSVCITQLAYAEADDGIREVPHGH